MSQTLAQAKVDPTLAVQTRINTEKLRLRCGADEGPRGSAASSRNSSVEPSTPDPQDVAALREVVNAE